METILLPCIHILWLQEELVADSPSCSGVPHIYIPAVNYWRKIIPEIRPNTRQHNNFQATQSLRRAEREGPFTYITPTVEAIHPSFLKRDFCGGSKSATIFQSKAPLLNQFPFPLKSFLKWGTSISNFAKPKYKIAAQVSRSRENTLYASADLQ